MKKTIFLIIFLLIISIISVSAKESIDICDSDKDGTISPDEKLKCHEDVIDKEKVKKPIDSKKVIELEKTKITDKEDKTIVKTKNKTNEFSDFSKVGFFNKFQCKISSWFSSRTYKECIYDKLIIPPKNIVGEAYKSKTDNGLIGLYHYYSVPHNDNLVSTTAPDANGYWPLYKSYQTTYVPNSEVPMGYIQPDSSVIPLGMQKLYYYYGISNSDARLDLVAPVNGVHPQNSNYVSPASHSVMGLIWQSPGSERRAIYEYYTKSTQNYGYWTIAPENGHLPNNPSIGFVRIIGYVGESADYEEEVPTTPAQLDHEDSPFGWLPAVTIADEIDDAKDIGLKWTRESTSYSFITDYNKGPYNFKEYNEPRKKRLINYDHTLTEIASAGINILGLFWVEEAVEERSWIPTDEMEYRNFIKAVVERYDGDDDLGCIALAPDCYVVGDNMYPSQETINALKSNPIKYWEVENEPNYNIRLHNGFAELQKITYEAIKQANPEAQVLIGGVAGWTSDYSGVSFQKHFKPILTELNGQHMDIFNIHWYGCANGDYKMIDHGNEEEVLTIVKDALEENGFSRGMSIWITETGSSTGVALGSKDEVLCEYTSETKQAGDYVKRYVYATKEGIDKLFGVLNLGESFWITYEHYFSQTSLIYDGKGTYDLGAGIKKLSYYSIKLMIDKLTGSDWDNVQEVYAQDNVYAYKLIKDGQPIYVAWWDSWEEPDAKSKSINLEVDFNGDVIITKAVPTGEGVSEINGEDLDENNYPNFFNTETKTVNNGIINLQLRGIPVYVEPISS